jgi:hypothetical protein
VGYIHGGNSEENANGYVVFKLNLLGSAGKQSGWRHSLSPHPFLQQASGQMYKDDVNGFSSQMDICFMDIYDAGGYDGVSWGAAIRPGNLIFIRAL